MIYAGIDVAKDKHDCLIVNSNGKALSKVFTITNNKQGFNELFANLKTHSKDLSKLKVGLEATGHYSNNLLEFLIANDLPTTVINPLHIMTIPGISYRMAAIIIAETGNFVDFDKAEKVLAFAGLDPSVYQSGQLTSTHTKMVKRGSKYLRYALFNAAKYVCYWDEGFKQYLQKKRSEGKPYNIAVSHAAKKLTRVIFHLVKTNQPFISMA